MAVTTDSFHEEGRMPDQVARPQPTRQCIGCGRRGAQGSFLRLRADRQASTLRVVAESGRERTGRGAYLCLKQACMDRALQRKAFQRAFRATVTVNRDEVAAVIAIRAGYGEANKTAGV
jgi:uncharacterized protein